MAQASVTDQKDQKREVLPDSIQPKHYFISYSSIDLESKFTFSGRVEIDLVIKKDSKEIKLNSEDIDFKKVSVVQSNNVQEIDVKQLTFDKKTAQTSIPLKSELVIGEAKLIIFFDGELNDKMKGFYRSKYKLSSGSDGFCGCTQFEATDARRAFPCWDEPSAKATFSVEITCNKSLTVLSNMPIINTSKHSDNDNLQIVLFDVTPIMSTYLLAWVVGEFESVESKTDRGILVRVWTTIGKKNQASFACDVACRCLDFYEKYFEINYPLPKCDMIAVPDFAAGAMENWGLITYREVALLCTASTASLKAKQYVCIVVCHELAHQWFGNLVTMDWWSQLWLNEGFAVFMEYLSADDLYPSWNMWNLFIISDHSRAFELDAMTTSHPIEVDVNTASEAEEVFDTISYCKGACVIRMLESFLGKNVFRLALKKYLNNFKYSNAVTGDLWNYLGKESKKSVDIIMRNWTRNQGYPLITADIDNKLNKLKLKQKRFLISGSDKENTIWNVPMSLKIGTDNNKIQIKQILFEEKEQEFDIPSNTKYIHINSDSTGFYCSQYSNNMLTSINENDNQLSMIDRMCLIRDTKALAMAGVDGATLQLLELIRGAKHEQTYLVWNELLSAMGDIVHIIDNDQDILDNINIIMMDVLSSIYNKLGWGKGNQDKDLKEEQKDKDKEDETTSGLFRPLIIGACCKYKNKKCISEILDRFHLFMDDEKYNNDTALPSELRSISYVYSIKNGGEKEFNSLKKFYLTTDDAMQKGMALRSLGYVNYDSNCIDNVLEWIISSDEVRKQDKVFPYRTLASSSSNSREKSWQFLQKRWNDWFKLFEGGFLVQHLAKIPSQFVTLEKAKEVQIFFDSINAPVCKRAMKQCIETITQNAIWRNKEIESIRKWAQQHAEKLNK